MARNRKDLVCKNCNTIFDVANRSRNIGYCPDCKSKKLHLLQCIRCGKRGKHVSICKSCLLSDPSYVAQWKSNISKSLKGKGKTGGYRTKSGTSKKYGSSYNGIWMDSSWEVLFAKRLDYLGELWEKSPRYFEYTNQEGERRKYYPDFFLKARNLYVEIKGYHTPRSRQKMQAVLNEHDINLVELKSIKEIEEWKSL